MRPGAIRRASTLASTVSQATTAAPRRSTAIAARSPIRAQRHQRPRATRNGPPSPLSLCDQTTSASPDGVLTTWGFSAIAPAGDRVRSGPSEPVADMRRPATWLSRLYQTTAESPASPVAATTPNACGRHGDSVITGPIGPPRGLILACAREGHDVLLLQASHGSTKSSYRSAATVGSLMLCQPAAVTLLTGVQLASAGGTIASHTLTAPAAAMADPTTCRFPVKPAPRFSTYCLDAHRAPPCRCPAQPRCQGPSLGEINRTDWGITANMARPTGGVVVGEKIQLVIEVEASLKTQ